MSTTQIWATVVPEVSKWTIENHLFAAELHACMTLIRFSIISTTPLGMFPVVSWNSQLEDQIMFCIVQKWEQVMILCKWWLSVCVWCKLGEWNLQEYIHPHHAGFLPGIMVWAVIIYICLWCLWKEYWTVVCISRTLFNIFFWHSCSSRVTFCSSRITPVHMMLVLLNILSNNFHVQQHF